MADGVVWVTRSSPEGVQPPTYEVPRVDASTLRRIGKPAPVESYPLDVDVADGTAWVTNAGQGTVTQVRTDGTRKTIRVGVQPISSVLHKGTLWVPDFWGNTVTPVQAATMRLSADVIRMPHPRTHLHGGRHLGIRAHGRRPEPACGPVPHRPCGRCDQRPSG